MHDRFATRLRSGESIERPHVTTVGLSTFASCVGGGGARFLHRHVRCRGAQRVTAGNPDRSRRRDHRPAMDRRRLHTDVRCPAACRRSVQRPHGGTARVHRRCRRFCCRVGGVWPCPGTRSADRGEIRAGLRRGGVGARVDGVDRPGLPEPVAAGTGGRDLGDGWSGRVVVGPGPRWAAHRRVMAPDLPHQHPHRHRRRRPRHSSSPSPRRDVPFDRFGFAAAFVCDGRAHPRSHRGGRTWLHVTNRGDRVRRSQGCRSRHSSPGNDAPRVRSCHSDCSAAETQRWPSSSGSRSSSATTACRS